MKRLVPIFLVFLAMTGCAQLQSGDAARNDKSAAAGDVMTFAIPPDALGARDPQLSAVLAKAGAVAASQKKPTTILVIALSQDFTYLNQAIWKGVPAQHAQKITLENQTAGLGQPYSVSIRVTP